MKTVSPTQCQCARVLLKWDQKDLAARCGLHVQTICLFETEQSTPTKRTLEKITLVLENAGIEFLDGEGVRRVSKEIRTLRGVDGFRELMDDVYEEAKTKGCNICIFNADPSLWYKWLGREWYEQHVERMIEIKSNYTFRVTTNKGVTLFIARDFAEYRWFSEDIEGNKIFYCYGQKLAFMDFEDSDLTIRILNQPQFAEALHVLFDKAWNSDTTIPVE